MLGDRVEKALALVGITSDRVTDWLGRPCGCPERKQKFNQIDAWARRVIAGKTENARRHLLRLMGSSEDETAEILDDPQP